jgi:hypothetical protein
MADTKRTFDPDETRRDDSAYWAAAAVVADRAGDADRAELARRELARLGYKLDRRDARKAVRDAR